MKRSKGWLILAAAAAIVAGWAAAQPKIADDSDTLMREKLKRSQDVLEGVTLKDYAKIEEAATWLMDLSIMDGWTKFEVDNPEYRRNSENFRETVEALIQAAKEKNIQGATLRFTQTTFSCVACHEAIRDDAN